MHKFPKEEASASRDQAAVVLQYAALLKDYGVTRVRLGAHQRRGSRSPPKCGRRTAMRAGPRSMAAASSATRTM
jgi:hypothetical protein